MKCRIQCTIHSPTGHWDLLFDTTKEMTATPRVGEFIVLGGEFSVTHVFHFCDLGYVTACVLGIAQDDCCQQDIIRSMNACGWSFLGYHDGKDMKHE